LINLGNIAAHNKMRKMITGLAHSIFFVYMFGFLTAGNCAGHSMNTFPKVGDDWIIKKKHFNKDASFL